MDEAVAMQQATWEDATPLLRQACEDLAVGELVCGEDFSLFEAMSALEIMDPQMDAGMKPDKYLSVEEALEGGLAPLDLSTRELIDVMDQLLACEATWHRGVSLAQTVYTCLYVLRVDRTAPNPLLHGYCRAVRATCNAIRALVCRADVYEEEDFVTSSFGLPLEGDVDSKSLLGLTAGEELLVRQLKAAKKGASSKPSDELPEGKGLDHQQQQQQQEMEKRKGRDDEALLLLGEEEEEKEGLGEALLCRLRFRRALFHTLACLDKPEAKGLQAARKHIASALGHLAAMRASATLLAKPPSPSSASASNTASTSPLPPQGLPPPSTSSSASSTTPSSSKSSSGGGSGLAGAEGRSGISRQTPGFSAAADDRGGGGAATSSVPTSADPARLPPNEGSSCESAGACGGPTPGGGPGLPEPEPASAAAAPAEEGSRGGADAREVGAAKDGGGGSGSGGGGGGSEGGAGGGGCTASGRAAVGFCTGINKRVLAPAPPRPVKVVPWAEALAHFKKLLGDLERICSLPTGGSVHEVLQFVADFQLASPGPIARCRLQMLIVRDGKFLGRPLEDVLYASLRLPKEHALSSDVCVRSFITIASQNVTRMVRAMCGNMGRQRRHILKMLPDLNDLLDAAELAGQSEDLRAYLDMAYPVKSWWTQAVLLGWSIETVCRLLLHMLALGFHSALYASSEFCYTYWYTEHVLNALVHNAVTREQHVFQQRHSPPAAALPAAAPAAAAGEVKDKKSKHHKKGGAAKAGAPGAGGAKVEAPPPFEASSDVVALNCQLYLCKAYVRLLLALKEDQKLKQRPTAFNTEKQRYEQRFKCLQKLGIPEPMDYSTFRRSTRLADLTVVDVYQMAYELFQTAEAQLAGLMKVLEGDTQLPELTRTQRQVEAQQLKQVAMRNRLAIQVAHRAGPGPSLKASFNFGLHPCYPVIVLKGS